MHSLSPEAPVSPFLRDVLALAPLVERFCDGRRVAVLGAATTGLAAELSRRGARLVHAYDPDPARVAEALITLAARGVSYATLTDGDLGVRDGAFDVTVVSDLSEFDDPAAIIARVRRLTAHSGVVVVANGASERALSYYDFYDALSLQLANVKMLGRVSFSGVSLVDLASGGDGDVSVDTSLAGGAREPEGFVAVGSERAITLDAFTLVELPGGAAPAPADDGAGAIELTELRAQLAAAGGEVERLREDRVALTARIAEADRRAGGAVSALVDAETVARAAEAKLVEESRAREMVSAELAKLKVEVKSLRSNESDGRALADATAALGRAEARERALATRVTDLEAALEARTNELRAKVADSGQAKSAELSQAKAESTRLAAEVARLTSELAAKQAELATRTKELSAKTAEAAAKTAEAAAKSAEVAAKTAESNAKAVALAKAQAVVPGPSAAAYAELEARVAQLDARLKESRAAESKSADGLAGDLAVAETRLRERAKEIAALKREIENRGDMVKDLVAQVSAFTGSGALGVRGG